MAMDAAQTQAFKTASGGVAPGTLGFICEGILFAVLLVWAAWALLDVWNGWANQKVRSALVGRFIFKTLLLLVLSLWMFGS